MKEWWKNLTKQQQQIYLLCAGIFAILIIYFLIWTPISTGVDNQRRKVHANQSLLQWMKMYDAKINSFQKDQPKTSSTESLVSAVQSSLKQEDFSGKLLQLQEVGPDAVLIHWQNINFDKMITWLIVFSTQHQLAITVFAVTPSATIGLVDAQLQLEKNNLHQ